MAEQDIVERLRLYARNHEGGFPERLLYTVDHQKVDNEAADRLEAVEAENASLRQRLAEARETARREALEEAATWHDAQVIEYTNQIAVNDAYLARGGKLSSESRANEYCDDQRSTHRRSAKAIRALSHPDRTEGERE